MRTGSPFVGAMHAMAWTGGRVLKRTGKATAVGFLLDGAAAAIQGIHDYRRGELSAEEAAVRALKQCSAGAISRGAGVFAAACVSLTGAPAPVVAVVSFGVSTLSKLYFRDLARAAGGGNSREADSRFEIPRVSQ